MKLAFLCGALRSGTSMTHLMLNAHPEISNPGEFDFFFDLHSEKQKEPEIGELVDYLSEDRIFISKNLLLDTAISDYSGMLHSFVEQMSTDSNILCLNIHRNFSLAYKYFPDAQFVHLIRDPRDVSRSSIGMGWSGNVYYGVDHWVATEQSWQELASEAPKEKIHELRFEELVSEPENTLGAVCDFFGVEYKDAMLDYSQHSSYSKPDPSLINQWKTKLKPRDIELVECKAKEQMENTCYDRQFESPRGPSQVELIALNTEDIIYRQKFAIKRYGFWLYIGLRFCEIFRVTSFRKPLLARKREVDKTHLK